MYVGVLVFNVMTFPQKSIIVTSNVSLSVRSMVRGLKWLAEATYTGKALEYALTNTIQLMQTNNRVVLVLTDGRSDITRDKVPLNVLCGNDIRVSNLIDTTDNGATSFALEVT